MKISRNQPQHGPAVNKSDATLSALKRTAEAPVPPVDQGFNAAPEVRRDLGPSFEKVATTPGDQFNDCLPGCSIS
jgi:hypothetical protein